MRARHGRHYTPNPDAQNKNHKRGTLLEEPNQKITRKILKPQGLTLADLRHPHEYGRLKPEM